MREIQKGVYLLYFLLSFFFFLNSWTSAEDDCTSALALDARNVKAFGRRVQARQALHKYAEALEGITKHRFRYFLTLAYNKPTLLSRLYTCL